MKLRLLRRASDVYPRISCVWEGCETCGSPSLPRGVNGLIRATVTVLSFLALAAVLYRRPTLAVFTVIASLLILPLHELCHVLYCIIAGKEVEGVYFLPEGFRLNLSRPAAYVRPGFGIYKRHESLLFYGFPLIVLTVFPTLVGLLVPSLFDCCASIAALNFAASFFDICDLVSIARSPQKSLSFTPFGLIVPRSDTLTFRVLAMQADSARLIRRQFEYRDGSFSELPFSHSDASQALERELAAQFPQSKADG